jgi:RimJ/RimL family protein N-acetyltransferase
MFSFDTAWPRRRIATAPATTPSDTVLQTYVSHEGRCVELRRLCPQSSDALRRFTAGLSARSVGLRFHVGSLSSEAMDQFARDAAHDDRGMVRSWLWTPLGQPDTVVGEVRLGFAAAQGAAAARAELGIVIADDYQRQGIGLRSVEFIQALARQSEVQGVKASVLAHNLAIIGLLRHCDFELMPDLDDPGMVHALWPRTDGGDAFESSQSGWQRLISRMVGL